MANITFKYFISCCRIENDLVVKFKLDRTTTARGEGWRRRRRKTLVQSARDVPMPPQFSSLAEAEYLDPKHLGCGRIQPLTCWLWVRDVPMPPQLSSLAEAEYLDPKHLGCSRIQRLTCSWLWPCFLLWL